MIGGRGVSIFRHLLLNSGLRPCTITLVPNGGMGKVLSQTPLSRTISMCRRLNSTLPATSQKTPWKPLSDPEANRAALIRVMYVAGLTGSVLLALVWMNYTLFFSWIPLPDRVKEMRKRV